MTRERAAVYARISEDRVGAGLGVQRQQDDCERHAKARGWEVVAVHTDNDLSAYRGKARPAFAALQDGLKAGDYDVVVTWHLDRLTRTPRELEDVADLLDATGARLSTVTADLDFGSDDGLFAARILGAVAAKESADKSRRLRRKAEELAYAGKLSGGGSRGFGFEPDHVTIRESEAERIREAARRLLAGDSLYGVCETWNAEGVTTSVGAAWQPSKLRRVLVSARVAGKREHGGEVVADAVWPPILPLDQWQRLRTLLLDPQRRTTPPETRRYLLTGGIARCGLCGCGLLARPHSGGTPSLVCAKHPGRPNCGKLRVQSEPLDELVVGMVLEALDTPALLAAVTDAEAVGDDRADAEEVEVCDRKLNELAEDWASDRLTRAEWLAARTVVERRRDDAQRRLARARRGTALDGLTFGVGRLHEQWDGLTLARRRAVLSAVVERVDVGPAVRGRNRFDPDRVTVVWRF